MTGGFSPRLVPTSQSSSPNPSIAPAVVKQEPGVSNSSPPGWFYSLIIVLVNTNRHYHHSLTDSINAVLLCRTKTAESQLEKEDDKRFYIKKPLNAFMLYMREERPKVVAQCNVKESATINQILGQRVRLSAPLPVCCSIGDPGEDVAHWLIFLATVALSDQRGAS